MARVLQAQNIVSLEDDDDGDDVKILLATPAGGGERGSSRNNAISVEQYCQHKDRTLHLARMDDSVISITTTTSNNNKARTSKRRSSSAKAVGGFIDVETTTLRGLINLEDDDDDDVKVLYSFTPASWSKKPFRGRGAGESSSFNFEANNNLTTATTTSRCRSVAGSFMCEICYEPQPYTSSFRIKGCAHSYCSDCINQYVASKLQESVAQILCPANATSGCVALIQPEDCRSILPPEVFDRWGNALCEAAILASEKFYCPFKDCSFMLIDDRAIAPNSCDVVTQSECPACRRLFCAECKVPWHAGIQCADFQKLNEDERGREDIMLLQLVKEEKWTRCSKCQFYVEKSDGCLFMRCRCGYTFCYNCGAPLKDHYCNNCKR